MATENEVQGEEINYEKSRALYEGKARKVFDELLVTEKSYMAGLKILVHKFKPSAEEKKILPPDIVELIFGQLPAIYNLNVELFKAIETQPVGKAFLTIGPFLKVYSLYAKICDRAREEISKYKVHSNSFAKWKVEMEQTLPNPFIYTEGYLITPIQRIPRYLLLLKELVKQIPEDHSDVEDLKKSTVLLAEIANHVNDSVANAERLEEIVHIQNQMTELNGPLITPGRVLLKKGVFIRVREERCKGRYLFLFNDYILCARPTLQDKYSTQLEMTPTTTFIFRDAISFANQKVTALQASGSWYDLQYPEMFWFELRNTKTNDIIIFGARSESERDGWIQSIEHCIVERRKSIKSFSSCPLSQKMTGATLANVDMAPVAETTKSEKIEKRVKVEIVTDAGFSTRYKITLLLSNEPLQTVTFEKRYSEILQFYNDYKHHLFLQNKEWQPFPGKKITERFQPWVLEQRRTKFELMFEDILASEQNLNWPEVKEFLGIKSDYRG